MRSITFFFLILLLCAAMPLQAQERPIVDATLTGKMEESYDIAQVSGPPLVGLRLGTVGGKFDPDSLIVVRPEDPGATICLRATTQDGRYAASNRYRIEDDNPAAGYVRLQVVSPVMV